MEQEPAREAAGPRCTHRGAPARERRWVGVVEAACAEGSSLELETMTQKPLSRACQLGNGSSSLQLEGSYCLFAVRELHDGNSIFRR